MFFKQISALLVLFVLTVWAGKNLGGEGSLGDHIRERLQGVPWSYGGERGPAAWGGLSAKYRQCSDGQRQSPIALPAPQGWQPAAGEVAVPKLSFHYRQAPLLLADDGHVIRWINGEDAGYLEVDGQKLALTGFDFHSPAEHTVGGKRAALEIHLSHRGSSGEVVMVAILFDEGEENPLIKTLWESFPAPGPPVIRDKVQVNPSHLLPAGRDFFHYDGSLSVPPCSEEVRWFVMEQPMTVSLEQLATLRERYRDNFRPLMETGGRPLALVKGNQAWIPGPPVAGNPPQAPSPVPPPIAPPAPSAENSPPASAPPAPSAESSLPALTAAPPLAPAPGDAAVPQAQETLDNTAQAVADEDPEYPAPLATQELQETNGCPSLVVIPAERDPGGCPEVDPALLTAGLSYETGTLWIPLIEIPMRDRWSGRTTGQVGYYRALMSYVPAQDAWQFSDLLPVTVKEPGQIPLMAVISWREGVLTLPRVAAREYFPGHDPSLLGRPAVHYRMVMHRLPGLSLWRLKGIQEASDM